VSFFKQIDSIKNFTVVSDIKFCQKCLAYFWKCFVVGGGGSNISPIYSAKY